MKLKIVTAVMIFITSAVIYLWNENSQGGVMADTESEGISKKTVCLGRYLIGLPAGAEISFGGTVFDGWKISSDDTEDIEEFKLRLLKRETELAAAKNENNCHSLESARKIDGEISEGKIFIFDRKRNHHWEGDKRIVHESTAIEGLIRIDPVSYRFFIEFGTGERADQLKRVIDRLRYRKKDEIPDQSGFCFENGFLLDPVPRLRPVEHVFMFAGYPHRPDVAITLGSMSGITMDKTLLQRDAESALNAKYPSNFFTIFKGPREINGIPGEEASERIR